MEDSLENKTSHVFLIGVHRAGTTSLFRYFNSSPHIEGSIRKELHYFTSLVYGHAFHYDAEEYHSNFGCQQKVFMEASPSYFYGGKRMAQHLTAHFPEARFVLVLRNPTDRFLSFYFHRSALDSQVRKMPLESFIDLSFKEYKRNKIVDSDLNRAFREGVYADYLMGWLEESGNRVRLIHFDELRMSPGSVLSDTFEYLGMQVPEFNNGFTAHNQSRAARNYGLHRMASRTNTRLERFFLGYPKVKGWIKGVYSFLNERTIDLNGVSAETRYKIDALYLDHNDRLRRILINNDLNLPSWLDN